MTQTTFKNKLNTLYINTDSELKKEVITEILNQEDTLQFVKEVTEYGCASGAVPSLIYYQDTRSFYDKHYLEIEAIREELQESSSLSLPEHTDLKNYFAWLGFEVTASRIAEELGIEY